MEETPGRELFAVVRVQYFLWSSPFKLQVEACAPKGKVQTSAQEKTLNTTNGLKGAIGLILLKLDLKPIIFFS